MPYIGTSIATNFASTIRDNFTGDGSTTSFTLSRNAVSENDLEVFVGNVRQQPGSAYTVSTNTLAFTGTPANGEVIYVVHQAGALQTVRAGTDFGARDLQFSGDSQKITFGIDSDVTLTHVPDSGLAIKSIATADDKPVTLVLQTGETDIAADDKLGVINFQAPDEATGTDAILVAAGIEAVSEGDFSASSNATKLSFLTGSSGTATEKMSISSGGNVAVTGNMTVGGDLDVTGTVSFSENNVTDVGILSLDVLRGDADTNTSITFSGSDVITFTTGGETQFTVNNGSIVPTSDDDVDLGTASSEFKDIYIDGTAYIDALDLNGTSVTSTAAELNILDGVTSTATEINLIDGGATIGTTAVADGDGILHNDGGTMRVTSAATFKTYFQEGISTAFDDLSAGDAAVNITTSAGNITIDAQGGDTDIIFKGTDGSSDITPMTLDMSDAGALLLTGGKIDLKNSGSRSKILFYCESGNAHAQTLQAAPHSESASNTLTLPSTGGDVDLVSTASTATLTNKTLTSPQITTSIIPSSADGATIGSASAEFSDLFLADGGIIKLGNDQDVTITHVADTGILINSTNVIQFNDASQNIGAPSATVLDINATDEIELNATLVDVNANLDVSGTYTGGGLMTTGGNIVIPDAGNIGSASDTDAIAIASNGAVTLTQALSGTSADFDGGVTIDNITIDGTEIDLSSGDLTIDVAGEIVFDADGGNFFFNDAGTSVGRLRNVSSDFVISSEVSDKDLIFKGNDGGSTITALTLDMSDAGTATFNHDIKLGDNSKIKLGASGDLELYHDGNNSYVDDAGNGALIIRGNNRVDLQKYTGETMGSFNADGAVHLYHDNSKKFETSANGINIFGDDLRISNDDGQAIIRSDDTSGSSSTDYGDITFKGFRATSDETTPLFLDGATAKVGIGTTAPLSLSGNADPGLTIKSTGPYILLQDSNNANTIRYIANNGGLFNMGIVNDDGSSNKTEQFTLASDGATVITSLTGSNYALKVFNDRNNNDGYGIVTQVGTDDPSGTHYHIVFTDGNGDTQGSITSDSGTVTYGAFTAHHPCIIPDADNDADSENNAYPYGTLLEITSLSYIQKNGADTERGILYNVQKSSSAKSKAVLGAYGSSMNGFHENNNLHQALILGDGHILCNNENGNIAIGDYICTSSTSGEGMKATNICTTIGIAREAITFSNSTAVLVAVEYGYRQFIPEDLEARITALEG